MNSMRSYPEKKMTLRMADGGMKRWADGVYQKGSLRGGRVEGAGDGTVDTVKAEYANGEYVLPADTAEMIGYDKLDAIKDATHTPVAEQRGKTLRMADGGALATRSGFTMPSDVPEFPDRVRIGGTPANAVATRSGFTMPGAGDVLGEGPAAGRFDTSGATDARMRGGNPNVGPGGSAEARVYQAGRTGPFQTGVGTPSVPPSVPPAAAATSLRQSAMPMVKDLVKNGFAGAAGYAAADVQSKVGNGGPPGTSVENRANVNAIPTDGYAPAPAALPYNAFTDTEVGRNVGNALNATGPLTGAVGGLLRAGSGASRMANTATAVAGGMAAGTGRRPDALAPGDAQAVAASAKPAALRDPYTDDDAVFNKFSASKGFGSITQLTTDGVRDFSNLRGNPSAANAAAPAAPGNSTPYTQSAAYRERSLRDGAERNLQAGYAQTEQDRQEKVERRELAGRTLDTSGIDRQIAGTASLNERKMLMDRRDTLQREFAATQKNATDLLTAERTNEVADRTARASAMKTQQDRFIADRTFEAGRSDAANAEKTAEQARGFKSSENATRRLESLAIVDDKIDPARLQQVRALTNSIAPGFDQMDEAGQNSVWQKVLSAYKVTDGANRLRDPGYLNYVGLGKDSPESSTLPDFDGADVSEVGFFEGLVRPKIGRGDYAVTKDGRTQYIPRANVGQNELEMMKNNGARLRPSN